jgi:transaldolase
MIGRLDDFLREVALDNRAPATESDIRQAGIAVAKRAYSIYRERGYHAILLVAALRGEYHLTELAGADLVMSIAPAFQELFVSRDLPRQPRIDVPVPADVIERLSQMPEFLRAYNPDGMSAAEFVGFGPTQRTLCQFCDVGWKLIENLQ